MPGAACSSIGSPPVGERSCKGGGGDDCDKRDPKGDGEGGGGAAGVGLCWNSDDGGIGLLCRCSWRHSRVKLYSVTGAIYANS